MGNYKVVDWLARKSLAITAGVVGSTVLYYSWRENESGWAIGGAILFGAGYYLGRLDYWDKKESKTIINLVVKDPSSETIEDKVK